MTNSVYHVLSIDGQGSKELAALAGSGPQPAALGDKWLIQSRSEDGLNIHYQLLIVPPKGLEYEIRLPWQVHEACPHCQGQGLTYIWRPGQASYESVECPECMGKGAYSYDSSMNLVVSDGLGGRRVIRKSGAGRLNARLGLRGDMILNLTWVEELPPPEDQPEPGPEVNLN